MWLYGGFLVPSGHPWGVSFSSAAVQARIRGVFSIACVMAASLCSQWGWQGLAVPGTSCDCCVWCGLTAWPLTLGLPGPLCKAVLAQPLTASQRAPGTNIWLFARWHGKQSVWQCWNEFRDQQSCAHHLPSFWRRRRQTSHLCLCSWKQQAHPKLLKKWQHFSSPLTFPPGAPGCYHFEIFELDNSHVYSFGCFLPLFFLCGFLNMLFEIISRGASIWNAFLAANLGKA